MKTNTGVPTTPSARSTIQFPGLLWKMGMTPQRFGWAGAGLACHALAAACDIWSSGKEIPGIII